MYVILSGSQLIRFNQSMCFYMSFYSAWLYDEHHSKIRTITNRIAAITNLDMETVEPLQVVNYGIGGQYEPHYDMSRVGINFYL